MAERPRCLGSIDGWYWMVLSGGKSSTRGGDDLGDKGHHVELGRGGLVGRGDLFIDHAAALPAARLLERNAGVARGLGQRVGSSTLALGRSEDADDLVAILDEPLEDGCSEGGLTDESDAHGVVLSWAWD